MILGAHKVMGSLAPSRVSCEDFLSAIDRCDFLNVPFKGPRFTWVRTISSPPNV